MSLVVRLVSHVGSYLVLGACIFSCAHGSTLADDGAGGDGGTGSAQNTTANTTGKGTTSTLNGNATTGASTTKASTTSNVQPLSANSVTVQAATTGSQMGACDTGQHGSLLANATQAQQTICTDCVTCSQTDQCANEWNQFGSDPDEPDYADCITQCGSDSNCLAECSSFYPDADNDYNVAVSCSICMECLQNCDAADTCM